MVPTIDREHYTVWYERVEAPDNSFTFVHCDVRKWTPTIKRALLKDFQSLASLVDTHLFALHDLDDTKHTKFLTMFGFKPVYQGSDLPGNAIYRLERNHG